MLQHVRVQRDSVVFKCSRKHWLGFTMQALVVEFKQTVQRFARCNQTCSLDLAASALDALSAEISAWAMIAGS